MVGLSKDITRVFDMELAQSREVQKSWKEFMRSNNILSLSKRLLEIRAFGHVQGRFHHGVESFVLKREFKNKDGVIKRIKKHTSCGQSVYI